jgi:hypothetical protein
MLSLGKLHRKICNKSSHSISKKCATSTRKIVPNYLSMHDQIVSELKASHFDSSSFFRFVTCKLLTLDLKSYINLRSLKLGLVSSIPLMAKLIPLPLFR